VSRAKVRRSASTCRPQRRPERKPHSGNTNRFPALTFRALMGRRILSMQASKLILDVQDLGVHRGRTRILSKVSWTVSSGQHWAMLGANGSGKTSLLKAITGYLMPSTGSILLLGQNYGESDWRELRKCIGIVSSAVSQLIPEDEPAVDTVTSGQTAMIGLWRRIVPRDRTAAYRLLRQLGCVRLAERPWNVLSQGERQRVLIARALVAQPALLILDEPCAGLDPVAREHFLQFLDRLGRQRVGPALVLVTHHVEEIMPVFSHVVALKAGHVLASGPKKTVLTTRVISEAFGGAARVRKQSGGRYRLAVAPRRDAVV